MMVVIGVLSQMTGIFLPGNLPGDISIKKDNFSVHIPIVTSIFLSIILSVIFWLVTK
ncbi:MAG: DUF2905 domain-containing protein [Leptospiraceae bacterium]|nr:DUF2905 domain-containing protein [Leptospiraceae bacterium]